MKKRLRKKLHLNEFTEFGIDFKLKFKVPISNKQNDKLLDNFIDLVEKNNTYCVGGSGIEAWDIIVEIGTDKNKIEYFSDLIKKFFEQNIPDFDYSFRVINSWFPPDDI